MQQFAERQRQQLYGAERNRREAELKTKLTASHILRNGEFNINKDTPTPGFQWSTVTWDDYKQTMQAKEQGKQYDESYKTATGSDIPIRHEGIPADTYTQTSTKDAYTDKGVSQKRDYIGNDSTTNWPNMTPRLIKGHQLGHSEYKDIFTANEENLKRPHYAKIKTSSVKLPLPLDERKHKVNVDLGCEPLPMGGVSSEVNSRYLQTNPKGFDEEAIREMKKEMEWNSKVFRDGDYNRKDGEKQTMFDVDFGKRPKGNMTSAAQPHSSEMVEEALDAAIQEKLHFMPQLIDQSMKTGTARQDGEDGKKYHTHAHFNLGSQLDKNMSIYHKDYTPYKSQMKPDRVKPVDARILTNQIAPSFHTTHRMDYHGMERAGISQDNMAIRKSNMQKQTDKHINFNNTTDSSMQSVFTRDFPAPPEKYATMKPATEKKCEFDFLESNGMLANHKKSLKESTENTDNFRGSAGASGLMLNNDKARLKSAAKRRLKSGRRAHFSLGNSEPSFKTVSSDAFTGRPCDDENIPAAGKVEKESKEFSHLTMSENTKDMIADPEAPSNQESRTAKDNYGERKKQEKQVPQQTVMRLDYMPMEVRSYTVPQLKQMNAVEIKASKGTAKTHFFHTDTSAGNNYLTTAMTSYIKPEEMSGKVHLSSLQ